MDLNNVTWQPDGDYSNDLFMYSDVANDKLFSAANNSESIYPGMISWKGDINKYQSSNDDGDIIHYTIDPNQMFLTKESIDVKSENQQDIEDFKPFTSDISQTICDFRSSNSPSVPIKSLMEGFNYDSTMQSYDDTFISGDIKENYGTINDEQFRSLSLDKYSDCSNLMLPMDHSGGALYDSTLHASTPIVNTANTRVTDLHAGGAPSRRRPVRQKRKVHAAPEPLQILNNDGANSMSTHDMNDSSDLLQTPEIVLDRFNDCRTPYSPIATPSQTLDFTFTPDSCEIYLQPESAEIYPIESPDNDASSRLPEPSSIYNSPLPQYSIASPSQYSQNGSSYLSGGDPYSPVSDNGSIATSTSSVRRKKRRSTDSVRELSSDRAPRMSLVNLTNEEKQAHVREQNNRASRKYRQKRKEKTHVLTDTIVELENEKHVNKQKKDELERQVEILTQAMSILW